MENVANTFCFEKNVSKKLNEIGSGVKIKDKFSHHAKILFFNSWKSY